MASGHYHRRWSGSSVSGGAAASNLGGTYKSLSSAVEPSTHGTSWNSVRWNKPSAAYRDHSSRIGSTFSSTKPSYSLSTADRYSSRRSNDYKRPSLDNGPSPGSYASRRSSLQPTTSSTPRYLAPSLLASPNPSNSSSYSPSTNNRYEPSKRYTSPSYSSSRTSSYNYNSPSNNYSSPSNNYSSPTSNYSSALAAALGKAERPWRTRMADSARQRAYGGEATPPTRSSGRTTPRSRRSSASSGDELSTAVASLKNYADSAISNGARYGKKSLGSSTVPTISENIALLSSNGNAENDKRLPTSALRDCYLTKSYPPPTRTSPTPVSPHSSSPLAVSLSTSRDFSSPTPLTKKWPGTQDLQPKSPTLNSSRHSSRPDSPSEPSIIEGESAAKDANDAACFQYSDVDVVPLPSGEGGGVSEVVEKKAKENGSSQDEPPSVAGSEKQKKRRLRKRTTLDKLSPSPANASGNQSSSDEESRVDSEEARPRRRRRSKARQRETSVEEDASVAIAAADETKKTKKTSAPPAKLQRSVTDVDNGEDDVRTCLDDIEQTFVDTAQLLVNDIDKLVEEALASDNNDTQQSTKSAKANVKKDEKSSSVSLSEVSKKDVEKAAAKVDDHADAPDSKAATKPKTVRVPLKPKRTSALKDQTKKEAEDDAKTPVTAPSNNKNKQKATTLEKVADSAKKLDAGKESEFKELNGTEQRSEPVAKAPEAVKKEVKPLPPKEISAKMAFTRPNPELIVEHVLLERVKEECAISLREPCKPLVELFIDVSFQLMGDEQECDINRGMPRASVTHRNLIREPCKRLAVEPPITALALVKKALVSPSSTVRAEITIKVAPKVLAQLRTASSTNRVAAVTEILRRPNSIGRAEIVVRTRGDSNKIGNLSKSGNSKSTPLATARATFAAVPRRGENSAGQQPRTSKDGGLAATGDLPWRSAGRGGERAAVVDSSTFADDDVAAVDELARAEALLSSLAAWERDQQKRRTLGGDQQQQQPLSSSGAGAGRFGVPSAVPIADQRRSLPVVDQRSEQVAKNRTARVPDDVQQPKQQQQQPGEKWRKPSGPSSSIESGVSGAAATKKKRQQTNGALFSPSPTAGALSPFSAVSAATDSPASSSLLLPAPVVRVLQPPRNKQRATITPSRQRLNSTDSQLSYASAASAASSTASGDKHPPFSRPTPSLSEVDQNMLDLLTLGEQLSGSRASLQTIRSEPPTKCMPLITPAYKPTRAMLLDNFDEALSSLPTSTAQHQRKASIASTISNNSVFSTASSDLLEAEAPINSQHRRALSSRYPASATARPSGMRRGSSESVRTTPAAPPVTRLERYAAHIPVRDQEPDIGYGPMAQLTPSRHSLTSVDSFATAATGGSESQLDAAAKQVEQMINEAKYRHRQHRSKFKEAIDYLDQIYEDIRKECDQFPKEISNSIQRTEQNAEVFNQDPHPPPIPPAPASYVPSDQMSQLSEYEERVLVPPETMAQNRLCGDRLDFMRKWLEDDIKSWTNVNPKPDLLVPCDLPSMLDLDERSVGSASAEVAAINEHDGKQSRRLHPHHAPDLIPRVEVKAKAAPVRRGSNQTQSSTDSARNMIGKAIEKTQQTRKLEAHRLSFPNNVNMRLRDPPTTVLTKSGNVIQAGRSPPEKSHRSFEAYDYLPFQQQKAVSENYYGRIASGAAAVVRGVGANNANSSRHPKSVGSVHSLPESALIRPKAVRAVPPPAQQPAFERQKPNAPLLPDHLLTLDNLVAELDLNTDGMTTSMEMRQSFPTAGIHREEDMLAVPEYSHPRHHEKPMSSSYDRDVKKSQHQRTLDEATNLLNAVAGEYGTRSAGEVMSPYLDKNDELGGQRVDYMRSMFESKNNEEQQPAWRRNVGGGSSKSTPRRPSIPNEDEGNYYEINDLLKPSSPRSNRKAPSDAYPPVPISSLPARPPEKKYINSLPSSSQDLDYDDDGNYDNIPMPISNRVSQRSSPSRIVQPAHQVTASNSNLSKSQAGAKLSQLLRKIGGSGSSRPPQPASSMIALHKTSHEQSPHPALYKSNSVGYEPWAKDVLNASTGPTPTLDNGKKAGLGKRLKQSLFGSSKRK